LIFVVPFVYCRACTVEEIFVENMLELQIVLSQQPLGLVFDIDGTLSLIQANPYATQLWDGVSEDLEQARKHAHVAILTGRAVEDGARIVNVEGLTYIGNHGLEWCDGLPSIHKVKLVPEAYAYVQPGLDLFQIVEEHLDELPKVLLQRKSVGGSVNYRLSPNPTQARLRLLALLSEPAKCLHMRLVEGRGLVEILPPLAVDKGKALRRYIEHAGLKSVIFAGDDRTDLDAILEMKKLREEGISTLSIVVQDADTLPALLEHGDVMVDGVRRMAEQLHTIVTLLKG
jgi:trehalose 6-phosphate phosphatase